MRNAIACTVAVLFLAGCSHVIRDTNVYKNEVNFLKSANMRQAKMLKDWTKAKCCQGGSWSAAADASCKDAAELVLTVEKRVPYHTDFMLFLADLKKERPAEKPPEVPEAQTICSE